MGQVTIYLDGQSEQRMKKAAKAAGVPISRWLAALVQDKTRSEWPETVRAAAGAWSDFSDGNQLRKAAGKDVRRETL